MTRRTARFTMSLDLLRDLLRMPVLSEIVEARVDLGSRTIEFVAFDPALEPASSPHEADPTITEHRYEWKWNLR